MKKLIKLCAGHYYFKNEKGENIYICKVGRDSWCYCVNDSKSKGTFKRLREARYKLT